MNEERRYNYREASRIKSLDGEPVEELLFTIERFIRL